MKTNKLFPALLLTGALCAVTSQASIVLQYDFSNKDSSGDTKSWDVADFVNTSLISSATAISTVGGASGSNGDNTTSPFETPALAGLRGIIWTDAATDYSENASFTFTVGANPLSLDTFDFAVARESIGTDKEFRFRLRSNLTGTTNLISGGILAPAYNPGVDDDFANFSADLSGNSSFQNLASSSSVTFTMEVAREASFRVLDGYMDKFQVTGTAIPEPSSIALIGLALGIVLKRLRNRK